MEAKGNFFRTTGHEQGCSPNTLFLKEKEHLNTVGNMSLLEDLLGDTSVQVVPSTMLVSTHGRSFSMPRKCTGKTVKVITQANGNIVVTLNGSVVAAHDAHTSTSKIYKRGSRFERIV